MDFIPGFAQGVTRVFISYPFDYMKTHLQMNKTSSMSEFVKNNTIRSMYRGSSVLFVAIPFERAIQYKLFETFNKSMNPFFSGVLCGSISSCISLPMNTVINNFIINEREKSITKYIRETYASKPLKYYFYGYKPELTRSIVSTTVYFGVYGNMRNRFGNSNMQCAVNSIVAGTALWTIAYPFETIKVEQQTNNNAKMTDIVKRRVSNYGVMNMWKGIMPVYIRTVPSSVVGMFVYENVRKWLGLDEKT